MDYFFQEEAKVGKTYHVTWYDLLDVDIVSPLHKHLPVLSDALVAKIHYGGLVSNLIKNADTLGKVNAVRVTISHSYLGDKILG